VITFPGWRRRSKRSFPRQIGSFVFCTLCGLRSTKRGRRTGKHWPRSQEDLPGRNPREGGGSLAKPARTVGHGLSQDRGALENQSLCPSCVFTPPQAHPKVSHTTNLLERLAKEVKRRTKVVEVFCDEGDVENLLYLILSQLGEAWGRAGSEDLRKSR